MKKLITYLIKQRGLEDDTIFWIVKHQRWCKFYGTTPETIKPNEVIVCIEELTIQYQDRETVNVILSKIKWYYEYLVEEGLTKTNPFNYKQIENDKNKIFKQIITMLDKPEKS